MKVLNCGIFLVFGLILTTALAAPSEKKAAEKKEASVKEKVKAVEDEVCGECDTRKCPKVTQCLAGLVRDRCGCCDVCGLEEDQLCNHENDDVKVKTWYGRCGVDLECRQRTDVDSSRVGNQSVCFCLKQETFCGTDNETYSSHCKFTAKQVSSNGEVGLESYGPCKIAPKIKNKIYSREVKMNSEVSLRCEVEGYPMSSIQWTFTRPNGIIKILPGDDIDVSISTRGGPGKYHETSFLLITNIQYMHEGSYGCMATNSVGADQMLVRVVVSGTEGKEEM